VAVHDQLKVLRADLPPKVWDHRFADPFGRLTSLLSHYVLDDRDTARTQITAEEQHLVDDLLNGRLDLR
jgi:hypothetical protein